MADLCVNMIMQISHHYSIASPLQSTLGTNNLMGPSGTSPLGIVDIFASINIKTMTANGKNTDFNRSVSKQLRIVKVRTLVKAVRKQVSVKYLFGGRLHQNS